MSVKVENTEVKNVVKMTIEVPAEDLEKAMQAAYMKQKKDFNVPGFRKGKVPRNMIEKMYGPAVFYEEAANTMINDSYPAAYDESGLDIVSRPTIDIVQIEKGKAFIYTAEVAVKPEVTLGNYKGVEVTKADTEPTDDEIQAEIEKELKKNARMVTVEDRPAAEGDTVVIDFDGTVDGVAFDGGHGENHNLKLGSNSFIPGFEDQLVGKNAGEDVNVEVTFPEDYHAKDLAGKAAVFACKIHEIKSEEVPEFDQDFVEDVSEFDTVDEYKADIKEKLAANKKDAARNSQSDEAIKKIVEASQMDIPDAMIDARKDEMLNQFANQLGQSGLDFKTYMQYSGTTMEQLKEQMHPEAISRIQSELVLEAIAKAENIEISDEDVDAEVAKMAAMYQMEADQLKSYMGEDGSKMIKEDLKVRKALDIVLDAAVEVEKPAEETTEE